MLTNNKIGSESLNYINFIKVYSIRVINQKFPHQTHPPLNHPNPIIAIKHYSFIRTLREVETCDLKLIYYLLKIVNIPTTIGINANIFIFHLFSSFLSLKYYISHRLISYLINNLG